MAPRTDVSTNGTSVDFGRLLTGMTLIAVGGLFWLDEVDRLDIDGLWELWPLALIALGLGKILRRDSGARDGGWVLLTLGALFLLDVTLDIVRFERTWPILLLAGGASMVWRALREGVRTSSIQEKR